MKKFLLVGVRYGRACCFLLLEAPECTAEMLTQKGHEMPTTPQEAVTKDPSKATELIAKAQEFATKYQAQDGCRSLQGV